MDEKPITLTGTLYKAQTMVDGGWRLYIDVPESDSESVLKITKIKDENLGIAIVPIKNEF